MSRAEHPRGVVASRPRVARPEHPPCQGRTIGLATRHSAATGRPDRTDPWRSWLVEPRDRSGLIRQDVVTGLEFGLSSSRAFDGVGVELRGEASDEVVGLSVPRADGAGQPIDYARFALMLRRIWIVLHFDQLRALSWARM